MSSSFSGRAFRICVLALACMSLCLSAVAQSTTDGAVGGTVMDQQKAVVPGATVTVHNNGTNQESTASTDEAGRFRVTHLQPGTYSVTVAAANFSQYKHENVIVEVGRITEMTPMLAVATKGEVIEVVGEAPVINTMQSDYQNNINDVALNELPVNARRWSSFALGTPGAVADGSFGLVAFRGISGLLNSNTVDGGDNNNAYFSEERGRTRATATMSQDAIREFQVNTSNFSSEFGRAAGGVVNAVTKSGSNQLHGSGRLFVTDSAMWTQNPFAQKIVQNGTAVLLKPADRRYQFGGNLGGPITKDKLLFLANWYPQQEDAAGP